MKKLLLALSLVVLVAGCNGTLNNNITKNETPYKEYTIIKPEIAETVSTGILNAEGKARGFNMEKTSAHVTKMTVYHNGYVEGTVKILGELTPEKVAEIKESTGKDANGIISYECNFEYSEKTNYYIWNNQYVNSLTNKESK